MDTTLLTNPDVNIVSLQKKVNLIVQYIQNTEEIVRRSDRRGLDRPKSSDKRT